VLRCNIFIAPQQNRYTVRRTTRRGNYRMLNMLILICAANVSAPDCQVETALDIIHGPQVASVFECGMASQVMAARTSLLRRAPGEYMKVRCTPVKATEAEADHVPAAALH